MYEARIVCDAPGCISEIRAEGLSREAASTNVQAAAFANGWFVCRNRLHVNRDKCPAHGEATHK